MTVRLGAEDSPPLLAVALEKRLDLTLVVVHAQGPLVLANHVELVQVLGAELLAALLGGARVELGSLDLHRLQAIDLALAHVLSGRSQRLHRVDLDVASLLLGCELLVAEADGVVVVGGDALLLLLPQGADPAPPEDDTERAVVLGLSLDLVELVVGARLLLGVAAVTLLIHGDPPW